MKAAAIARGLAALALLFSFGVYVILDFRNVNRTPSEAEWDQAARIVRAKYQDGDIVVFEPPWSLAGLPHFLGLRTATSETIDWYAVSKYRGVFVVASMGQHCRAPNAFRPSARWRAGRLRVCLFMPPPGKVVYDFLEHLNEAIVERVYPSRVERCTLFVQHRWHCKRVHPWQFVGEIARDIAHAERKVIWFHPLDHDNLLRITYPGVPLGKRLVVHYGFTQRAIETGKGAPVRFVVKVEGREVLNRVLRPTEAGWFEFSMDMSTIQRRTASVSFEVSTPNHKDRQLCFTADVWG